jgi:transcription elongation GreA/GreB family factor
VPSRPNKTELMAELVALLEADLDAALRSEKAAQEAATHEEAKPENDKDTRALEQSYLARGQSIRTEDIRVGLAQAHAIHARPPAAGGPVALGSLVIAEEDGHEAAFFVAPARGGTKLSGGVQVVTPSSPLGRALIGKREGDDIEVKLAQKTREIALVRVE